MVTGRSKCLKCGNLYSLGRRSKNPQSVGRYKGEPTCMKCYVKNKGQKVFPNGLPPALQKEIKSSLDFLAETDLNLYGKVTKDTKDAFRMQKVKLDIKRLMK